MKRISFILLMVLLPLTSLSQNNKGDIRFAWFINTSPGAIPDDGFNFGGGIEYQMSLMYFNAQIFVFPNLNGVDYYELSGTPLGFNIHNRLQTLRAYTGIKLGFIRRGNIGTYPLFGTQFGGDVFIGKNGWFIGGVMSYDTREDFRIWENNPNEKWQFNGLLRLGKEF